jgi:hypothetical protein
MKAYWGSGGIVPCILDFGIKLYGVQNEINRTLTVLNCQAEKPGKFLF